VVLQAQAARRSGQDVYTAYCASCHDHPGERIPAREALARMSPARILRTLDFGLMMSIAYPIRRDEREAVAKFLGTGADETAPPATAFCKAGRPIMSAAPQESWVGWGPSQANTRFQATENAGLTAG
jgi:polyvinyl alcohol dehydrogenase (cytochrome)